MKKITKEKIKSTIEILAIALPALVTIISVILEKVSSKEHWDLITLIFTLITLVCSFIVLGFSIVKDKNNKKMIKELKDAIDYYCEGKRFISDETNVEFLKDEESYKISIKKKFEVLSLENDFYPFYISCDKFPENANDSAEFYKNQCGIWNNINLKASISVERNGKVRYYDNIYYEKVREENNHIYFKVYYQQIKQNQRLAFSVEEGDIVTISYSFVASTLYWGSYINRKINFHGTETVVNLLGVQKDMCTVLIIDMDGKAERVENFEVTEECNNLRILLPKDLPLSIIKRCFFRVYWDANSIFGKDNLNSCFVGAVDPFLKNFD